MQVSNANSLMQSMSAGQGNAATGSTNNASLADNFLTMLTAELRNQDPTNPMDSSQMVTQLSQISTAQGLVDLKELTQTQILALLGNQRLASAELIGKTIDYKTNALKVGAQDQSFSGYVQSNDPNANHLSLKVKDKNGLTVKTIDVQKGADGKFNWTWDGKDSSGNAVARGDYALSVTTSNGVDINADVVLSDKVNQVNFQSDGSTNLKLASGGSTSMGDVVSIAS